MVVLVDVSKELEGVRRKGPQFPEYRRWGLEWQAGDGRSQDRQKANAERNRLFVSACDVPGLEVRACRMPAAWVTIHLTFILIVMESTAEEILNAVGR